MLTASLGGVRRRAGPGGTAVAYASPELYLGTQVNTGGGEATMGLDDHDAFERCTFAAWDHISLGDLRIAIRRRRRELAGS